MNSDYEYLVGVQCMTYQHVKYIQDALGGFVMQQTTFPFTCMVMDDASTDGEIEVLRKYIAEQCVQDETVETEHDLYFKVCTCSKENSNCRFEFYFLKQNLYGTGKKLPIIQEWESQCKYIALCEGDDYWTDPLKLQKQVGFLESHEECSMCVCVANIEIDGKITGNDRRYEVECEMSTDEMIRGTGLYVALASTIYRKSLFVLLPRWQKLADVGDWPLHIQGTLVGKVHYFPEIMCTYRYQHAGSWTANNIGKINLTHMEKRSAWLQALDEDTNYKYHRAICTVKMISDSVLFVNKKISLGQYLHTIIHGDGKKKANHIVKDCMLRYAGIDLRRKKGITI